MNLCLLFSLFLIGYAFTTPTIDVEYCVHCDIMLGALVPVRPKSENESKFGKCGPTNKFNKWAMPRVEALLFAVDKVNRDPNLLANYTLGIHILDTCGIQTIATEKAKKFLQKHQFPHPHIPTLPDRIPRRGRGFQEKKIFKCICKSNLSQQTFLNA